MLASCRRYVTMRCSLEANMQRPSRQMELDTRARPRYPFSRLGVQIRTLVRADQIRWRAIAEEEKESWWS